MKILKKGLIRNKEREMVNSEFLFSGTAAVIVWKQKPPKNQKATKATPTQKTPKKTQKHPPKKRNKRLIYLDISLQNSLLSPQIQEQVFLFYKSLQSEMHP